MAVAPRLLWLAAVALAACGTTQQQAWETEEGLLRDYSAADLLEPVEVASDTSAEPREEPPLAETEVDVDSLEAASLDAAGDARFESAKERGEPADEGTLSVRAEAKRRCKVQVGDKRFGTAPTRSVSLPAGKHRLTLTCKGNKRYSRQIEIDAGEHTAFVLSGKKLKLAGKPKVAGRSRRGRRAS